MIPLSDAANRAKAKWNSANYTQIKVSVYPDVAASFKASCAAAGSSMASVLSQFMTEYSAGMAGQKPHKKTVSSDMVSTKKKRSKSVGGLIRILEQVRDAEEQAMANTPENLQGAENYQASEERMPLLDEALDILERIY